MDKRAAIGSIFTTTNIQYDEKYFTYMHCIVCLLY